ncbi:MAG: UTP--glucose-1-phosphate uridylyltransferase GalU [Candidatus Kerfeldbacteria bacterium]|nr:UTP--glucose-1-phosphate uridylyltransferase GalU [Candidatus Kerfeldbacteria bacterium]
MKTKIRKAVIPVAGFGTRFLPATKAQPKEMLPVVDKPIIQYVVEEAAASGIEDIIIVTGWQKRSIEDHFDYPFELEKRLKESGKIEELDELKRISNLANFIYIRQRGAYGNGTPALNAKHLIGDEPFVVMWGDEFIYATPPRLKQMIRVYEEYGHSVISAVRIPNKEHLSRYGIADVSPVADGVFTINTIVEKPKPDEAPSNLATHGAYLLTPSIFHHLERLTPGKDGEIWLVDAIRGLMKEEPVYACELKNAVYYDTGNKLGWLQANVEFGLRHPTIGSAFRDYLMRLSLDS